MSIGKDSSPLKVQIVLIVGIVLTASLFVIKGAGIVSSKTQPATQENPLRPQVKKFVDRVPKHLPLKIKIKNAHNEKWVRDLEVEVTNISDKPIYFLEFFIVMTDVKSLDGNPMGFPLRYGRIELVRYSTPLQSDDVPIQPGETHTFKTPESSVIGWEKHKTQGGRPEPKRVELIFVQLNFGDGTGFQRTDGSPVPRRMSQSSATSCKQEQTSKYAGKSWTNIQIRPPASFLATFPLLPAAFLPVNFFGSKSSFAVSPTATTQPDVCCPGTPCNFRKADFYQCVCLQDARTTQSAPCSDPFAECSIDQQIDTFCPEFGVGCPEFVLGPCCTLDADNDGFTAQSCGGPDCRDDNPDINPNMFEGETDASCTDRVDNDCDRVIDCDEPSCRSDPVVCPTPTPTPTPAPPVGGGECSTRPCTGYGSCDEQQWCPPGSRWCAATCECRCNVSPILIDIEGDGFDLTDFAGGWSSTLITTALPGGWPGRQ